MVSPDFSTTLPVQPEVQLAVMVCEPPAAAGLSEAFQVPLTVSTSVSTEYERATSSPSPSALTVTVTLAAEDEPEK